MPFGSLSGFRSVVLRGDGGIVRYRKSALSTKVHHHDHQDADDAQKFKVACAT